VRIDKFLWCVRLFKTRSLATEACNAGKILIEGIPVKPSREVKPDTFFNFKKTGITYLFKIKEIPKSRVGAPLVDQFLENCTPKEELEKLELLKLAKSYVRPRGLGRPTKKERRDIESFLGED
jgi:ribosome-associated heat shock protein Hsp15